MKVKFDHESHCIYKHLTCSACNLFEDISKEERRLSNKKSGKLENDQIGHNFHKAFGWMVGAVSHAAESEDPFLAGLADELRAVYQKLAKSMEEDIEEAIQLKKEVITAQGKIINKLTEHYQVNEDKDSGGD